MRDNHHCPNLRPTPVISSSFQSQDTPESSTKSHFLEVHEAKAHAELAASRTGPLGLKHLFQPVVVRQYLHNGKLYKETAYRKPSRFELFFDLAYAGLCHILGEEAAEASNGPGVSLSSCTSQIKLTSIETACQACTHLLSHVVDTLRCSEIRQRPRKRRCQAPHLLALYGYTAGRHTLSHT